MAAKRKFDHDKARELRASGLSYGEIARRFGVTSAAVGLVCDSERRARQQAYHREWQRAGQCPTCGQQATRTGPLQHECQNCSNLRLTKVKDGMAHCSTCKDWKPLDQFTKSTDKYRKVRGECRACGTIRRRDWRQRNRAYENMVSRARKAVASAVRTGILIRPQECPQCGSMENRIEAHHEDHSKPLEVEWLCSVCHTARRYGRSPRAA